MPNNVPNNICEKLLADTLTRAPRGDLYVFVYGSLMWNPGFEYKESHCSRVYGFSRRYAIFSTHYRGTPKFPGLVFGLDAGGSCNGMVYRVAEKQKAPVMRYLFQREMFANAYRPHFVPVSIGKTGKTSKTGKNNNNKKHALTFVVRRDMSHYAPPMPETKAAAIIRRAQGVGGKNSDYLRYANIKMQQLGMRSPLIQRMCTLLENGERQRKNAMRR